MSKKEEILKKIKKFLKIFSENRNGYTPRKSTERTVANYYLTHTLRENQTKVIDKKNNIIYTGSVKLKKTEEEF